MVVYEICYNWYVCSWCSMKNKRLVIDSDDDYRKLLNKIWLYKSIFYYSTHFEVENNINNKQLDNIVKALNVKKRKDRIDFVYDHVCDYIDEYIKDKNICDFIDNKCFVQRRPNNKSFDGCCGPIKCNKLVNGKCLTKNISCKLFYCPDARRKIKVLGIKDIDLFKIFSIRQRLVCMIDVTYNREQILKDLYSYSFIYACLRIFFRDCINKISKR